jgi:hypothetical protein
MTRIPIPNGIDPALRAWLLELRKVNEAADAAEARLRESSRTEVVSPRQRPRASRVISRRTFVASQPRDARGRWVPSSDPPLRWVHGTNASYAWAKCRCDLCVGVWNARMVRVMRERRKAARAA